MALASHPSETQSLASKGDEVKGRTELSFRKILSREEDHPTT